MNKQTVIVMVALSILWYIVGIASIEAVIVDRQNTGKHLDLLFYSHDVIIKSKNSI